MKKRLMVLCLTVCMAFGMFSSIVNAASNSYGTWTYGSNKLHYIKTVPEKLTPLANSSGNISSSNYYNCINAGFFGWDSTRWPYNVSSIAVINDKPIYEGNNKGYIYGIGQGNDGEKGTLVYDRGEDKLSVQVVDHYLDLDVENRDNYYAFGGVSWDNYASEKLPSYSSARYRSAIVYDRYDNVYCIVTNSSMTAADFKKAVEANVNVENGIHLDGSGSSQMKYNNEVKCDGDGRSIPVLVGIWN